MVAVSSLLWSGWSILVARDSFVNGHVFQQVGFLSEGFATMITTERLLSRVGPQMNLEKNGENQYFFPIFYHKNIYLDVGLVEEPPVTYVTMMHHFLPLVPLSSTTPTPSRANSSGPKQTLKQKENINIL